MKNYLEKVNLRAKFFVGSMIIILIFGLMASVLYHRHLKKILMAEAFNKSEMVLREVEAIRAYVKEVLRPRMYALHSKEAFILEAMSSTYISLNIMKNFEGRMPGYLYRRVALNPRNPENLADDFEEEMFDWFEEDRSRMFWQGVVKKGSESFFVSMLPDYHEKACLHCHGTPKDAPPSLIAKYGPVGGFRFVEGDLAGVNSVSIPVSKPLALITKVSVGIFVGTVFMMVLLLFVLNLMFGNLVISRLSNIMGYLAKETDDTGTTRGAGSVPGSQDEIDHLKQSFGDLTRYVNLARKTSGTEPNFIGPYAIVTPIASGTLSWLYEASHTVSGETVLLKIPFHDVMLNPLYTACLRTEMKILERVGRHENLITITGKEGDALVAEALEGEDLETVIGRHAPYPGEKLFPFFQQLGNLVADLHTMGVIHHDLRPQNFIVANNDTITLIDMGFASLRDIPDAIFESGISPQGDFRYMAPEQMTGKRGDPRSDIYTLGVLLYQMCTGRLPFEKTRSTLKTRLHIKENFKAPTVYAERLSKEIESVVLKAMAWDVGTRYQWVEDLIEDIEQACSRPKR